MTRGHMSAPGNENLLTVSRKGGNDILRMFLRCFYHGILRRNPDKGPRERMLNVTEGYRIKPAGGHRIQLKPTVAERAAIGREGRVIIGK